VISKYYKEVDGTSFAAPIVSSIVAQMLEARPELTPSAVKRILIETSKRMPHVAVDRQGWGVVQPAAAVRRALEWAPGAYPHG
jgi:serine protease AprX